jgi:hypothetical protein
MSTWKPSLDACDSYLSERTGSYEYRAIRYRKTIQWMLDNGLTDDMTVIDVGAGWTEFDYTLRVEFNWRGRYIPIDGGVDGTDLNTWIPFREAHFFVALEILEHLHDPLRLLEAMKLNAVKGVAISTPNPETTDVLAMDQTHVIEVGRDMLESAGLTVEDCLFYGGVFSNGASDNLFGTWLR